MTRIIVGFKSGRTTELVIDESLEEVKINVNKWMKPNVRWVVLGNGGLDMREVECIDVKP